MKKSLINIIKIIPLVLLLCFAINCQKQVEEVAKEVAPVVDIEAEKGAVKAVFDEWVKSIETEDMELFSKVIAHDDDMVLFGTDAAEHFIGWEQFKESLQKQFDSFENPDLSIRELVIKVHKSGEVAWCSCLFDFKGTTMGEPFSAEGSRFTGVMEKRNGNWVIVQGHNSVPFAGQAIKY